MNDVGHILFGSQNYGISGPDSDTDYKVFLCPDFEDLYANKRADKRSLPITLESEHYSPIDVRTFDELVRVGNPNCIEMIFSKEKINLHHYLNYYIKNAQYMYEEGYLAYVFLPFFKAVRGMVFNAFHRSGVNRKTASRALYFYNFVNYVISNDYKINEDTWKNPEIVIPAKDLRFDEEKELPSLSSFDELFNKVERSALPQVAALHINQDIGKYKLAANWLRDTMKSFVMYQILHDTYIY